MREWKRGRERARAHVCVRVDNLASFRSTLEGSDSFGTGFQGLHPLFRLGPVRFSSIE